MADYIESKVGKDGKLLIEVTEGKGHVGFGAHETHNENNQVAQQAFNQAMDTIRLTAEGVVNTLDAMEKQPDHAKLDFGIKIDAEKGAMLARADSRGTQLRVSLGWKISPTEEIIIETDIEDAEENSESEK